MRLRLILIQITVNESRIVLNFRPMPARRSPFLDLISGRKGGPLRRLARFGLILLAIPYGFIIRLRNLYYASISAASRRVDAPVISIGNITVGGTGKTPMAARIARLLMDRGRNVAILSRGYKGRPVQPADASADSPAPPWSLESDEALVLQRRCPNATIVIDANRVAGAKAAREAGCDALVLDDGFQHRRLARDLDIVLIDATQPFGHGWMLPRGLLREPPSSLARAGVIVLTRSDEIEQSDRMLLLSTLRRCSKGRPLVQAVHRITGFQDVTGRLLPGQDPGAVQAVIFAGVANFESFRRAVERIGVKAVAAYEYPDHHDYSDEEMTAICDVALALEANAVVTTEKDAVKLVNRWPDKTCRLLVLHLEIEFLEDGGRIIESAIDAALYA
ncbi:MAG: tetraacyldisaccharide 4'-kinase [Planctomycetes bacterium]|nr:tetraacyldisaccharide 4'-kinase [Planctomycetota bacterium]